MFHKRQFFTLIIIGILFLIFFKRIDFFHWMTCSNFWQNSITEKICDGYNYGNESILLASIITLILSFLLLAGEEYPLKFKSSSILTEQTSFFLIYLGIIFPYLLFVYLAIEIGF